MFENFFSLEISPGMNRKLTGNDIFRPRIEFFGHEKYISYVTQLISALTYKHRKRDNKMSWQYTANSYRGGIVISYRDC